MRLGARVVGAGEVGRAADHLGQRAGQQASSAFSEAMRVAISFGASRELLLHVAHRGGERRPAARRACGARTRRASPASSAARRSSQAVAPACRALPAARHASRMSARNFERRRSSSRASRARRRSPRRRAASRAPSRCRPWSARRSRWWCGRRSAMGWSDVLRGLERRGDRRPDRGRRCASPPSRRPRSASPDRPSRQSDSGPSIEMPLSSNSTISLLSFRWPASAIASWLMPSIRSPSEAST